MLKRNRNTQIVSLFGNPCIADVNHHCLLCKDIYLEIQELNRNAQATGLNLNDVPVLLLLYGLVVFCNNLKIDKFGY